MNPQTPGAEPIDIGALCAREMARHGWKLAGEPVLLAGSRSFEERVRQRVAKLCAEQNRSADEDLVRRLVKTEYGCLLHQAVSLNSHRVQSIALEETIKEGWNFAFHKCNGNREDAETALYSALLKLWQHIGTVNPQSYFPYYFQVLIREIQQQWRRRGPGGGKSISLEEVHPGKEGESNPEESDESLADTGSTGAIAYERILDDLSLSSLVKAVHKCLKNPRWTFVVISNFVLELNASEIAAQLMTTVRAIYMIKHHARKHIREKCGDTLLAEMRM